MICNVDNWRAYVRDTHLDHYSGEILLLLFYFPQATGLWDKAFYILLYEVLDALWPQHKILTCGLC